MDKKYSWDEVSKHNTEDSLWLVVDGKVYDVTSFKDEHPGGAKPFLNYGGKDATKRFKSVQYHLEDPDVAEQLKELCIGTLELKVEDNQNHD